MWRYFPSSNFCNRFQHSHLKCRETPTPLILDGAGVMRNPFVSAVQTAIFHESLVGKRVSARSTPPCINWSDERSREIYFSECSSLGRSFAVYLSSQRVLQICAERAGIKFAIAPPTSERTLSIVVGFPALLHAARSLSCGTKRPRADSGAAANFDRQHSFKLLQGRV